jgi:hypothetical protein
MFKFSAAATRAIFIPPDLRIRLPGVIPFLFSQYLHDISGWTILPEQACHALHCLVYVIKEGTVAAAKVIQSRLPIRG